LLPAAPDRSIWAKGLPLLGTVPWSAVEATPIIEPVAITAADSHRGLALKKVAEPVCIAATTPG